jgi:hypothetical protein
MSFQSAQLSSYFNLLFYCAFCFWTSIYLIVMWEFCAHIVVENDNASSGSLHQQLHTSHELGTKIITKSFGKMQPFS